MIRNFEEYTHEMTDGERDYVVPYLIRRLTLAIGKDKALKNVRLVKEFFYEYAPLMKTSAPRVRKLIHILRVSDTILRVIIYLMILMKLKHTLEVLKIVFGLSIRYAVPSKNNLRTRKEIVMQFKHN